MDKSVVILYVLVIFLIIIPEFAKKEEPHINKTKCEQVIK